MKRLVIAILLLLPACSAIPDRDDMREATARPFVGKRQALGLEFLLGQYAIGGAITARRLPVVVEEGDPPFVYPPPPHVINADK